MNTVKAFVEIGNDNTYSVYVDLADNTLNYGIHGTGNTVEEAIADFISSYEGMKNLYAKKGIKFVEAQFTYQYDMASFLQYYTKFFSLAGLSRLTKVNKGQLSHYVTGRKRPRGRTVERISKSVHSFGKTLCQVNFV